MYRRIGKITRFSDIPWGKEVIVSGSIGKLDWVWEMKGIFEQSGSDYRFKNEFGIVTHLSADDFIALNVLEKCKSEGSEK